MDKTQIKKRVTMVQPLANGREIREIFDIVDVLANPKRAQWYITFSTTVEAPFCDKKGAFRSCQECEFFSVLNEDRGIYQCIKQTSKISYKNMLKRIEDAKNAGCTILYE